MHEVTERMLETAARRSAGCTLAAARLALAFDGSAAAQDQMADVHQLFSPASGAHSGRRWNLRENGIPYHMNDS